MAVAVFSHGCTSCFLMVWHSNMWLSVFIAEDRPSAPLRVLGGAIFTHYNPIRMSCRSFRATNVLLTATTRPPVQQRSPLVIYWFHTTPPRSTITYGIKSLILTDGGNCSTAPPKHRRKLAEGWKIKTFTAWLKYQKSARGISDGTEDKHDI